MELSVADCKRIIFWYHVAFETQELSPEDEQETDLRFLPELREPSNGDKMTLIMIQNIARILSDKKPERDEWCKK